MGCRVVLGKLRCGPPFAVKIITAGERVAHAILPDLHPRKTSGAYFHLAAATHLRPASKRHHEMNSEVEDAAAILLLKQRGHRATSLPDFLIKLLHSQLFFSS